MSDPITDLLAVVSARREWPPERRKSARVNAGVSTRELAAALGVTHGAVSAWEKSVGHYNPQTRAAERAYYDLLTRLEELAT